MMIKDEVSEFVRDCKCTSRRAVIWINHDEVFSITNINSNARPSPFKLPMHLSLIMISIILGCLQNTAHIVKFDELARITWFAKTTAKRSPIGERPLFDPTHGWPTGQIIRIP